MTHPACTPEEIVRDYENGLINYLHFLHAAEPVIDAGNVGTLLEVLPEDQQRRFVASYSEEDFGRARLEEFGLSIPSPDVVERIHTALRAWLETHPEQRKDAAAGFE